MTIEYIEGSAMLKKTKIVATIGPATETPEMMHSLVKQGIDVMRLNFSHGSHEEHRGRIETMRKVAHAQGRNIAILLDTKGPEIRTMKLVNGEEVALRSEEVLILTTDETHVGDYNRVAVTYKNLTEDVNVGNIILLDDGLISLEVLKIEGNNVYCFIQNSGFLGENKGVNLPGIHVNLPALSQKDKADIKFGCEMNVDFIAASFVRSAHDVQAVRDALKEYGGETIQIISKIENDEGIRNFDEILALSDGIMVARGDLGVEIPIEDVPFAQKKMIEKCNRAGKIVITATQMLDSMIQNPRPTRAEAGDVVNAIIDGTDAVMLSGETAKGKYPQEAVRTMAKICQRADYSSTLTSAHKHLSLREVIASGTVRTADDIGAKAIVILSESGETARHIKKLKPNAMVVAITTNKKTAAQLSLARGVHSILIDKIKDVKDFQERAIQLVSSFDFILDQDIVVLTSGTNSAIGITNLMKIEVITK